MPGTTVTIFLFVARSRPSLIEEARLHYTASRRTPHRRDRCHLLIRLFFILMTPSTFTLFQFRCRSFFSRHATNCRFRRVILLGAQPQSRLARPPHAHGCPFFSQAKKGKFVGKDTTPPPTRSPPLHIAGATRVCYRAQGLVADTTTLHQLSVDDIDTLASAGSARFRSAATPHICLRT